MNYKYFFIKTSFSLFVARKKRICFEGISYKINVFFWLGSPTSSQVTSNNTPQGGGVREVCLWAKTRKDFLSVADYLQLVWFTACVSDRTAPQKQTNKTLLIIKSSNLKGLIDAHRGAIKCKIGGPPLAIFPEILDPPPPLGTLAKASRTPSPGFSTRVHLWKDRIFTACVIHRTGQKTNKT
jgi:hypothetical protein